jgi:hypothetical protein
MPISHFIGRRKKTQRNVIAIDQSYKRETSEYKRERERESNLHHQLAI